jgi:hypothetical protein
MHRYVAVAALMVLAGAGQAHAQGRYRASTWHSIPTVPTYTTRPASASQPRPILVPMAVGAAPTAAPVVIAPQAGYGTMQTYAAPQAYSAPPAYSVPQGSFTTPGNVAAPVGGYGVPADYAPTLAPSTGNYSRYSPVGSTAGPYGYTTRGSFPTDDITPVTYAAPTTSGSAIYPYAGTATTPAVPQTSYPYTAPVQPAYPAATTRYAPATTYAVPSYATPSYPAPSYAASTSVAPPGSFGRNFVPNVAPRVQVQGQPPVVIAPQQYAW